MAEKRGTRKKADRDFIPPDRQEAGDREAIIPSLYERIALLEHELHATREELQVRQEEMEVQAEELETHLEELNTTNEALENEVLVRKQSEDALRKSQYILAKSQEMAHVGNWAWNLQTGEMSWSDESFRIFGLPPGETRPRWEWLLSLVHPDDRGQLSDLCTAICRTGKKTVADVRVQMPDGSLKYVNAIADKIVRDKVGQASRIYGIFQDISDRKLVEIALHEKMEEIEVQAEELESQNEELRVNYEELNSVTRSLHESEARFSAIYEHAAVGINMLSLDGRYLKVNQKFCEMTGYTREELLNLTFRDLYDAEDVAREEGDLQKLLAGEIPAYNSELKCMCKDGGTVRVNASCSPIKAEGKPVYLIRVIEDITERKRAEDRLIKQAALIDLSPDGIIVRKLDGEITFWSKGAETLYGWTSEEAVGAQTHTLFETRFPQPLHVIIRELQRTGRWSGELVHRTRDGREITVQSWWLATMDDAGNVVEILESNVDITDRKRYEKALQEKAEEIEVQAEELESQNEELRANYEELNRINRSLQESQTLLRAVTEGSPDPIYVKDRYSRLLLCNPALLRVYDRPLEEVIGKTDRDLYADPAIGEAIVANDRMVIESGRSQTMEEVAQTPDGIQTFLSTKTPYRNGKGEIIGIIGISRDITRRKQVEEVVNRLKANLEKAQEIAHLGSWELDLETNRLSWSDEVYRIFGMQPQEFGATYEAFLGVVHPDDRAAVDAAYSGSLRDGKDSYEIEHRVVRKSDGEVRFVHEKCQHIRDRSGRIVQSMGMVQDISERKRAEEELKDAKSQAELYLDLMGHDISNMHQIALSQLELAYEIMKGDGKLAGDDIEMISTPIETLQRSARLIDNVSKLQKLRAGEYRMEIVDVGRVLGEVVKEQSVEGNGITINYTPVQGCLAKANPLIKEVFTNLVGNAVKHSNGATVINIGVSRVSERGSLYHRITIDDTGPGIPDDKKDEIFHRFKRGQTKARGTGLGLYIVRTLVESFNGRVEVEDRMPGDHTSGSKFIVYLPVVEDLHE